MSLKRILRRVLLAFALGGHDVFGVGMSREQIEELLFAMHKPKIEVTISDGEKESDPNKATMSRAGGARHGGAERVKWSIGRRSGKHTMGLRKAKSIQHNGKKLTEIIEAHERFFRGKEGGARADLAGADLSRADLQGINLSGAILRGANLEGSDLRKAKLPGADLSGANLRKADLRNTDMTESILPGADLTEAQASGVEFFRCDLSNAIFHRAHLRNVNLRLANVNGTKFSGADMGVAILRETDLTGADLSGVDLSTTLMPRGYAPAQAKQKNA
jgi:uncharacterized protein YjbI with pentapeptide repeats